MGIKLCCIIKLGIVKCRHHQLISLGFLRVLRRLFLELHYNLKRAGTSVSIKLLRKAVLLAAAEILRKVPDIGYEEGEC